MENIQSVKKNQQKPVDFLFKTYIHLWKEGLANKGFSYRLPDYGSKYWFQLLQAAFPQLQQRSFLDIGAGCGRLSMLLLHTYSPAGVGIEVDINPKDWESITNRFGRFELKEGLLQDIVPEYEGKRVFDFIVLSEVFEHIPPIDVDAFIKQLHTVLAPGGQIFLTTPNVVVQGRAQDSYMWHEKMPFGHHKHYSAAELKELFGQYGFDVLWQHFECHGLKKWLYNKWYYPLARLDDRLLCSSKLPRVIKAFYRPLSFPFISLVHGCAWLAGKMVYVVEKNRANEKNASTIVMALKRNF